MVFEEGLFYCQMTGYVDAVDVRLWFNGLTTHVQRSEVPIIAVVDVSDAERVCPTMAERCESVRDRGNLLNIVVVTGDTRVSRNAQVFSRLEALPRVRLFAVLEKAMRFARGQLSPGIVPHIGIQCSGFRGVF